MKLQLLLTIFLTLIYLGVFSQSQGNIWYFGNNAGMDFNGGAPVALTDGALSTAEGSATICNASTGALLFYTDGITVWDASHTPMANGTGLISGPSSTQPALILLQPGSSNIYYIFTADVGDYDAPPNDGIHYSIVDMTLNGGLGDVTTKNVLLLASATEKLTATKHCNGVDYWVVGHDCLTNEFYTWLFSSIGVGWLTFTKSIGSVPSDCGQGTIGYMKFSPNGQKLALAEYGAGNLLELFDFDPSTGIISNFGSLTPSSGDYGVSFSPDNSKLYVHARVTFNKTKLYQFDLNAGGIAAINASKTQISSFSTTGFIPSPFGSLQLAPDGKIYAARNSKSFLGVINDPNLAGLACNYVLNGFSLGGQTSQLGLPNIMETDYNTGSSCLPLPVELISFTAYNIDGVSLLEWSTASEINNDYFSIERSQDGINFNAINDPIKGAGNSSTTQTYSSIDEDPFIGVNYYRLEQTDYDGNHSYSKTISISINNASPNPLVQQTADYLIISMDEQEATIYMYDILGREVYGHRIKGSPEHKISINNLKMGIYHLNIRVGRQSYQQKLVIY